MGARGAADRARQRAIAAAPTRPAFIGGSWLDDERARWCWDLVWAAPGHEEIAEHLAVDFEPLPGADHVGGAVAACIEQATMLVDYHARGRTRVRLLVEELEIHHYREHLPQPGWPNGHVEDYTVVMPLFRTLFGPPMQPRILVLALDGDVLPWIDHVAGAVWRGDAGIGVAVDHPLRGLTAPAARAFARDFIATTPSWCECVELEQAWGTRREQLLAFDDRMPEAEDA